MSPSLPFSVLPFLPLPFSVLPSLSPSASSSPSPPFPNIIHIDVSKYACHPLFPPHPLPHAYSPPFPSSTTCTYTYYYVTPSQALPIPLLILYLSPPFPFLPVPLPVNLSFTWAHDTLSYRTFTFHTHALTQCPCLPPLLPFTYSQLTPFPPSLPSNT